MSKDYLSRCIAGSDTLDMCDTTVCIDGEIYRAKFAYIKFFDDGKSARMDVSVIGAKHMMKKIESNGICDIEFSTKDFGILFRETEYTLLGLTSDDSRFGLMFEFMFLSSKHEPLISTDSF